MIIREIKLEDVRTMVNWGTFEDPRYHHFNFPYETEEEFLLWYQYKVNGFRLRTFGAFDEDQMIGFVTFKKINRIFSRAELGVIFDKNYVSQGYGTAAILECIRRIGLKKIYLFVSSFNDRAYRAYEKLGFEDLGVVYRLFETQEEMREWKIEGDDFVWRKGKLYGKYYKMELLTRKISSE